MSAPGQVEIDRSGPEPTVRIVQPQESFTVQQLRLYAGYLARLADEANWRPEPEVDALVAVFKATEARYMVYEDGLLTLARAVLAAGYKRETATAGGSA